MFGSRRDETPESTGGARRARAQWAMKRPAAAAGAAAAAKRQSPAGGALAALSKPGPASLEQLLNWPDDVLGPLLEAGDGQDNFRLGNLLEFLGANGRGLVIASDFSGLCGDREALRMLVEGLRQRGKGSGDVRLLRACDFEPVCQLVLKQISEMEGEPMCVFSRLEDRLPKFASDWIEAAKPAKDASPSEKSQAHLSIRSWLESNKARVFTQDCKSHCLTHDQLCYTSLLRQLRAETAGYDESETGDDPKFRPTLVHWAGTTCHAWTRAGSRQASAHRSEVSHAIYTSERAVQAGAAAEDIFFQENAELFPVASKLAEPLSASHIVIIVKVGPEDLGRPLRRRRTHAAGLNRETMVWLGGADYADKFKRFFFRAMQCTGDVWMTAPQWLQEEEGLRLSNMPRKNGRNLKSTMQFSQLDADSKRHAMLTSFQMARLGEYNSMRGETESWFCDLEQSPHMGRSTPGPILPSHLTHGLMWSFKADRPVHVHESLNAHGYNVMTDSSCNYPSSLIDIFRQLGVNKLKFLMGNGFDLSVAGACMAFAMCHSRRISRLASIQPERSLMVRGASSNFGVSGFGVMVQDPVTVEDMEENE